MDDEDSDLFTPDEELDEGDLQEYSHSEESVEEEEQEQEQEQEQEGEEIDSGGALHYLRLIQRFLRSRQFFDSF